MRIVSLSPAATEIVWALGLEDDLVGISHVCDHPPAVAGRRVVTRAPGALVAAPVHRIHEPAAALAREGGIPVELDTRALAELQPDLVLAGAAGTRLEARERQEAAIRSAVGPDTTIVTLEPASLEGIFHAIATVGAMADAEDEAVGLVEILRERLADVEEVVEERREERRHAPRVVALDWLDPPSSAGLWVPEQIRRAGGWEVLAADGEPSAPTSWEAVAEVDPEMLLLAPCGMHLPEVVRAWRATPRPPFLREVQAVRRGQVFALDASAYFSRPGPRVLDGIEILAEIFDPTAFENLAPAGSWVPVQ
jgi:iron complex transport system substrate-binding protein